MNTANYHLSRFSPLPFGETVETVTEALRQEGFGIITTIDMKETLKKKLGVDFRDYLILGACNPRFAFEALEEEDKAGVYLPCNVVVQEHRDGQVEVSIVDPEEMMKPAGSMNLMSFATQVKRAMEQVLKKVDGKINA